MPKTKFLKGDCQHCSGPVEFPAEMVGLTASCPHCGQETELLLAAPPDEPIVPRRTVIWTAVGILVLCLGFAGALVALKRAQRLAARQKHQTEQTVATPTNQQTTAEDALNPGTDQHGFAVSGIMLETTPGTSRVYATGTLKNSTDRKRFGVKVELDLRDAADQKVGTATDYQAAIEPGAEWHFRALVLDSKATSARLASIKEDQ
ncbi:MAG: FxLYD domain-containing protein [Limisphaerales bacterium]